jgi:hypothetical protein
MKSSVVKPHSICFNDKDLGYLGTGFVLYFFFLKYLMVIGFGMSVIEGYKIYMYAKQGDCGNEKVPGCNLDYATFISVANYGLA